MPGRRRCRTASRRSSGPRDRAGAVGHARIARMSRGGFAPPSSTLTGTFRAEVVQELRVRAPSAPPGRLAEAMGPTWWAFGGAQLTLARAVRDYDRRTRTRISRPTTGTGWRHVNPTRSRWTCSRSSSASAARRPSTVVPSVLIDYYFMHVLSLLTLRAWDEGRRRRQPRPPRRPAGAAAGPAGSGQQFARDAATLLLIATAHYEREGGGVHLLLARCGRWRRGTGRRSRWGMARRWGVPAVRLRRRPTGATRR